MQAVSRGMEGIPNRFVPICQPGLTWRLAVRCGSVQFGAVRLGSVIPWFGSVFLLF